jgi:hypothetical protein
MDNNNITNHSELESLKKEIKTELKNKSHKSLPFGNIAVTVMLGALTLVSIGQMMASVNIFNKLKTGEVKASTGAPQNSSIQSLPDMVGGC